MTKPLIAISGGMDPIHSGHIRLIKEAASLGELIVILNNDNWLLNKKGYIFIPEDERVEIVAAIHGVKSVVVTSHTVDCEDMSVCRELDLYRPDIFCNGGDRKDNNTPEVELCNRLGIQLLWNVGGSKIQSSSELVERAIKKRIVL